MCEHFNMLVNQNEGRGYMYNVKLHHHLFNDVMIPSFIGVFADYQAIYMHYCHV